MGELTLITLQGGGNTLHRVKLSPPPHTHTEINSELLIVVLLDNLKNLRLNGVLFCLFFFLSQEMH